VSAAGHVFGQAKGRLASVPDLAVDPAEILMEPGAGHMLSVYVNWGMPELFQTVTDERMVGPSLLVRSGGDAVVTRHANRRVLYDLPELPWGPHVRVQDLVSAINGDAPPEVSGEEGRKAPAVRLAALEALGSGGSVAIAGCDAREPTSSAP